MSSPVSDHRQSRFAPRSCHTAARSGNRVWAHPVHAAGVGCACWLPQTGAVLDALSSTSSDKTVTEAAQVGVQAPLCNLSRNGFACRSVVPSNRDPVMAPTYVLDQAGSKDDKTVAASDLAHAKRGKKNKRGKNK